MLPLDLHVLGLPPAFTLSQDQTLQLKLQTKRPKPFRRTAECDSSKAPQTLLFFFTCLDALCILDFHPPQGVHTSYLRTLSKILPAAKPEGTAPLDISSEGAGYYTSKFVFVNSRSASFLRRSGPLAPASPPRFAVSSVSLAGRAYYICFCPSQRLRRNFFAVAARRRTTTLRRNQTHPRKRALADLQQVLLARLQRQFAVLNHGAVDAHGTLVQLARDLRIARPEFRRDK